MVWLYKTKVSLQSKNVLTDTESLVIHIKTEDFYENIANDVEKKFDTSNYDDNRLLPVWTKK